MRFFGLKIKWDRRYIKVVSKNQTVSRASVRTSNRKTTIMNLINSYKTWRRYRETYNELARLGRRELEDLGIERSEIGRVARQSTGY